MAVSRLTGLIASQLATFPPVGVPDRDTCCPAGPYEAEQRGSRDPFGGGFVSQSADPRVQPAGLCTPAIGDHDRHARPLAVRFYFDSASRVAVRVKSSLAPPIPP